MVSDAMFPPACGKLALSHPSRSAVDASGVLRHTNSTTIGQLTAVYIKRGRWYVGYVEEISGVNTQGRTLAEAKRNLKDALIMVLEANRTFA